MGDLTRTTGRGSADSAADMLTHPLPAREDRFPDETVLVLDKQAFSQRMTDDSERSALLEGALRRLSERLGESTVGEFRRHFEQVFGSIARADNASALGARVDVDLKDILLTLEADPTTTARLDLQVSDDVFQASAVNLMRLNPFALKELLGTEGWSVFDNPNRTIRVLQSDMAEMLRFQKSESRLAILAELYKTKAIHVTDLSPDAELPWGSDG